MAVSRAQKKKSQGKKGKKPADSPKTKSVKVRDDKKGDKETAGRQSKARKASTAKESPERSRKSSTPRKRPPPPVIYTESDDEGEGEASSACEVSSILSTPATPPMHVSSDICESPRSPTPPPAKHSRGTSDVNYDIPEDELISIHSYQSQFDEQEEVQPPPREDDCEGAIDYWEDNRVEEEMVRLWEQESNLYDLQDPDHRNHRARAASMKRISCMIKVPSE